MLSSMRQWPLQRRPLWRYKLTTYTDICVRIRHQTCEDALKARKIDVRYPSRPQPRLLTDDDLVARLEVPRSCTRAYWTIPSY